jgi:hypothetical protein
MKLQKRILFACCALWPLVASSLASDHKEEGSKRRDLMQVMLRKQEQRRTMPGGYWPVENFNNPRVVNAANLAVSQLLLTTTTNATATVAPTTPYSFAADLPGRNVTHQIVKAFQQVVAGMNYRFVLLLQDKDTSECLGAFAVTVYDNFGTLQVTAWGKEVSCDRAKANLENAEDFESATGEHFNGSS